MLRIKTIRGGSAAAARYYSRETKGRPDEYYGREAEMRPIWWTPAGTFGVRSGAEAMPEEVKRAMAGQDPAGSGKSLVQVQRPRAVVDKDGKPVLGRDGKPKFEARRCAFDMNMSLPKTVSVVYAAADRDTRAAMLRQVRAAAVETLEYLHRDGVFTVRSGKGGKLREGAADVLALVDIHQSNRDGSPFLHVHSVVMAFGRRADGKTVALNDRDMHLAAGTAGALFRAGVAQALEREHGLAVQRVPGVPGQRAASYEVAGVAPELAKAFSGRRGRMVEYVAKRHGAVSTNPKVRASQMQEAAQNTRGSKARVAVGENLEKRWGETMRAHGTSPERVWQRAREAARTVQRPVLSPAETVAVEMQRDGGQMPERRIRQRIAEHAQYGRDGIAGAAREMERFLREGWERLAAIAERLVRELTQKAMERARNAWKPAQAQAQAQAPVDGSRTPREERVWRLAPVRGQGRDQGHER